MTARMLLAVVRSIAVVGAVMAFVLAVEFAAQHFLAAAVLVAGLVSVLVVLYRREAR